MKTEEIVPPSTSSFQSDKEIEALPPSPPFDDNKDKHIPTTVRRRHLSLSWKGLKSSLSLYGFSTMIQDQEAPEPLPQCAPVKSDAESQDQKVVPERPPLTPLQDIPVFPPRTLGLRPFSGPALSGYFSDGGSRRYFNSTGSQQLWSGSKSIEESPSFVSEHPPGCNFSKTAPAGSLPMERLAYRKASSRGGSSEIIYATDIDMAQRNGVPQMSASDIRVQRHRRRVRVKVKKTGKQHKQKKGKRRRVRLGKPLDPQDDEAEYILTLGMMLGLRVAVGRQGNPLEEKELIINDFYQVDKYVFPPSGSMGTLSTPSHKLGRTFKFKDYSPRAFRHIREHFGVDRVDYILSVAGNYTFLEFISNAKSGEFFFFSHDEKFMIKTMKSSEVKFLRRILPHYYKHISTNPQTLLVRYFGMYRVKMYHLRRKVVHFVVMNSVLDTHKVIHETFDIKGSTLGRYAKPEEKVKKDMDLVNRKNKIALGPNREAFLKIIEADVKFLASMNVMDYSLLLGIHNRIRPREYDEHFAAKGHSSPQRVSRFFNFVDEREGEDATKWQGEGGIVDEDYDPGETQNLACEWDSSTGEEITIEDEDDGESIVHNHSHTIGSTDSHYDNNRESWDEVERSSAAAVYKYDPESEHHPSEYSTFPDCVDSEEEAVSVTAAVIKCKAAEGRKTKSGEGQAASPQKLISSSKSTVFLPRCKDLGIQSVMMTGKKGSEVYFMGIIDMLQAYNTRKSAEHSFKALWHFKSDMSCVDPVYYSQRFLSFLKTYTE